MTDRPKVSVIISFLDAKRFIEEAIASVFAQTFDGWELLLVDDGSTDSSSQMARRYAQQYAHKISYFEHEGHRNHGQAASRNLGLVRARGEYVAILDADDVWLPYKLEEQVSILACHQEVGMVQGCTQYWYSWSGNPEDVRRDFIQRPYVQLNSVHLPSGLLRLALLGRVVAPCPSDLLFRRDILQQLGGFEEIFSGIYGMYEDQALLTKVYLNTPVYVANECWDKYRVHAGSFCAVQTSAGHEHSIRSFYLNWLVQYLSQQGVNDAAVWRAVRRMLWPYRHRILAGLLRPGVRFVRRMKRTGPPL